MDIFYYWKNFEADLAAERLGWLKSQRAKVGQLQDRGIDHIWAFKTPSGMKGRLQVVARLAWCDPPAKRPMKTDAASTIYYDAASPSTVRFVGTDAESAITQVTSVLRKRFHSMFDANFHGDNGVQKLEIDLVRQLESCVKGYLTAPLVASAAKSGDR
ncbi:MAG: hypothetical protein ACREV5_08010 [Steroidobacter sp.]